LEEDHVETEKQLEAEIGKHQREKKGGGGAWKGLCSSVLYFFSKTIGTCYSGNNGKDSSHMKKHPLTMSPLYNSLESWWLFFKGNTDAQPSIMHSLFTNTSPST
jgi:hypothetical protein